MRHIVGLFAIAAAALLSSGMAAPAQALSGAAADAVNRAAPAPVEQAWHRGRPHGVVCVIRYRRFFNGIFWARSPVRVCYQR